MSQQPPQYPQGQGPQQQYPQQQYPQQGPPQGAYGQPPGYYQQPYAAQRPGNGIAIAAMVCGIVGLVFCWIPLLDFLSIVLGALGLIFGFIGNGRAAQLGGAGRGMAIAGIITGLIAIAISVLFLVIFFTAVHTVITSPNFTFAPVPS